MQSCMCQHNLTFFGTGNEINSPYFDPPKGQLLQASRNQPNFCQLSLMEELELFDANSAEKKSNSKIPPCQIELTYFFLSLNDDDYILTITIVLKNEKKWRTISFCARPD